MSCGYTKMPLNILSKYSSHEFDIVGGEPDKDIIIKGTDIRTKRTGNLI